MPGDLNQCAFIGRLGSDPEVRQLKGGSSVCNMRIACGEKWKSKSGEQQEKTEWIPIVVWGKLAEICGQYLHKGSRIYISGKFATRKWQGQDGQERYTTEVVVDGFQGRMQMLDSKPVGTTNTRSPQRQEQPQSQPQPDSGGNAFDDDIPF